MPTERLLDRAQFESLLARTEELLGPAFSKVLRRHLHGLKSATPPQQTHRLMTLFSRLQDALDPHASPVLLNAAGLAAAELHSSLSFLDEWKCSPAWPGFRSALQDPANYLHTVGTLAVASTLREKHPEVTLQIPEANSRSADVLMRTENGAYLAVEVKAPQSLWQAPAELSSRAALDIVLRSLFRAGLGPAGQLAPSKPGLLAMTTLLLPDRSYDELTNAMERALRIMGRNREHLLGLAIFNLQQRVEASKDVVHILLEHQSTLRRNPFYSGGVVVDGDWAGPWRLTNR